MYSTISKEDMYRYTGDISQIFYAKKYTFNEGKAKGMQAVDINNGSGMEFTILADRAMDIGKLSFQGINFSYISKAGYISPEYFDDKGLGWLKSFTAGLLTTCGLTQAGSPCVCDGEELGQHGNITAVPAEEFCVETNLDAKVPEIIVRGKMRVGRLFGDNLWLSREIKVKYGENKIYIKDKVENRNGKRSPYMILYHFNLGYPLLDENIKFSTSARYIRPRDEEAEKGESERLGFQSPQADYKEQVFYYKSAESQDKLSYAGIFNEKINMGIKIWVDARQLPNLIQWKNAGYGDYVLGIEPANCYPEGRLKQKEYGLQYLEPLEIKTQEICIEII